MIKQTDKCPLCASDELANLQNRALALLDLITVEWRTDPMSVQCFDLRIVGEAIEIVARIKALSGI